MSVEEEKGSLQDLLKELLASTPPGEVEPPVEQEAKAKVEGEGKQEEAPQEGSSGQQPLEVVATPESTGAEAAASPTGVGEATKEAEAPQAPAQPEAGAASVLLEGTLEVKVTPQVSADRLALFERALKGREGAAWLGTWGRPGQGMTLRLRLQSPMTPSQLFEDMAVVERLEPAKAGQGWRLEVRLAVQGSQAGEAASAAAAPPTLAALEGPPLAELAPPPVPSHAPAENAAGQVDLEVTPIASLEALNRLEKLLSSFSPTCRVINVLSLDGVSTILVTLEGIDGGTLARKLQESISTIQLEVKPDRLVAQLPAKW